MMCWHKSSDDERTNRKVGGLHRIILSTPSPQVFEDIALFSRTPG